MNAKIFTLLLIIGAVIFTGSVVFAAKNYNSSKSNSTTIAIVNQQVGDILLRYGAGGAEINTVTEALAVGISEADLKMTLIKIGINEKGVQEVFIELDRLGIGINEEGLEAASSSDTGDTLQSATGVIRTITPERAVSTSDAESTDVKNSESTSLRAVETGTVKEILPSKRAEPVSSETEIFDEIRENDKSVVRKIPRRTRYQNITLKREIFHDTAMNIIQNIRSATSEERENLIDELQVNRKTFQTEIVSMNLSIREDAKELRDNFRERVETVIGHVDHGKTARIAVAHGKGLRMINRFRSATARFDHILNRLESRVDKLAARFQVDSFFDVETSIEEAKNISIENEAKLEQLKVKYESLLEGENPRGVAEEASVIAKELKTEIQTLHAKLREITDDIKQAIKNFNSSKSNTSI